MVERCIVRAVLMEEDDYMTNMILHILSYP